ncbi:MAG: hypothetical protein RR573_02975 [Oscillospiraceae bacterium]
MEMFDSNGHLTNEGLDAIISGNLDDMMSLEAAEHLSFCDSCLVRYSDKLEHCELLTPNSDIAEPVLKRIRNKGIKVLFTKYGTVAAAMTFAMTLWSVGAFTNLIPVANAAEDIQSEPTPIIEMTDGFFSKMNKQINGFFDELVAPNISTKSQDNKLKSELALDKLRTEEAQRKQEAEIKKAQREKEAQIKLDEEKKAANEKALQKKKDAFTDKKSDKMKHELKSKDTVFEQFKKSIFKN